MLIEPIMWFFAAIAYSAVTLLFLRNDELVGPYKWMFSFAVVPVFLVLMAANIWIADHVFPYVIEWHQTEWHRVFVNEWKLFDGYLARRAQGLVAFLITSLVPVAVCWMWYVIFIRLSRRRRNATNI